MAAPMTLPSHHLKGEVAENRPAYREGRIPKATKVYTVNQESAYLVVQGVPALGTSQELIQLFAVYGAVQEYRILDEFPTADKYNDVYLIKFQKIQAARFAKRKLDDYSFYGGLLHISYAPEFETVAETRDKLQERRRNIAARIRNLEKETQKNKPELQDDQGVSDVGVSRNNDNPQTQQTHVQINTNHRIPEPDFGARFHNQIPEPDPRSRSGNRIPQHDPNGAPILEPEPCYHLPLPPKQDYGFNPNLRARKNYEFARVPSAHATLPREMSEDSNNDFQHQKGKNDLKVAIPEKSASETDTVKINEKQKDVKTVNGLIVKNVPQPRSTPKFIPRQTLNIAKGKLKPEDAERTKASDTLREELQRNTFLLGKKQGPETKEERKEKVTTNEDESVHHTVSQIRKRVQEVFDIGTSEKKRKTEKN